MKNYQTLCIVIISILAISLLSQTTVYSTLDPLRPHRRAQLEPRSNEIELRLDKMASCTIRSWQDDL